MAKLGKTINNVIRGDARTVNLTFLQSDGSTPVDLTGGTVYFTVNSSEDPTDDTSAAFQKIATVFTSPLTGQHTFNLGYADTNITPQSYWYDAEFKDSLGNRLSSYRGRFIVQSDTTRN